MMDKYLSALCTVLDAGYMDIEFLFKELDNFTQIFDPVYYHVQASYGDNTSFSINELIDATYSLALTNALSDIEDDLLESEQITQENWDIVEENIRDTFEPFINRVDSHFIVGVFDEEIYDYTELLEAIKQYALKIKR